jgi:hypothetical protein
MPLARPRVSVPRDTRRSDCYGERDICFRARRDEEHEYDEAPLKKHIWQGLFGIGIASDELNSFMLLLFYCHGICFLCTAFGARYHGYLSV